VNDTELQAAQARIEALHERWAPHIGLGWWKIVYRWHRGPIPGGKDEALMTCEVLPGYHRAVINLNGPAVLEESNADLEEGFVHELMHVFLGPLWEARNYSDDDARRDVEEGVATALGHGFQWLREHCERLPEDRTEPLQAVGMAPPNGLAMIGAEHD
jgi:hypothetical protein